MAIAMRGTPQTAFLDTGSALSISKPSGVVSGDLILFVVGTDSAETRTGPTGFTSKSATNVSDERLQIWYKVADGTEGASFSCGAGSANSAGFCVAYSGIDNTTPFDVAAGTNGSGTGASITAASITPTTNGCQILFVGCRDSNANAAQTVTPPSGSWAEQVDIPSAQCWANIYLADFNQATAGAVGTTTATASSTNNATNIGILLALRPASGGGSSADLAGAADSTGSFVGASAAASALSGAADASASFTGAAAAPASFSAAADSSASFVGQGVAPTALSASADSSATFVGRADASSALSGAGDSTFTGIGASDAAAVWDAAATSTGAFTGTSLVGGEGLLAGAADSSALFVGASLGAAVLAAAAEASAAFGGSYTVPSSGLDGSGIRFARGARRRLPEDYERERRMLEEYLNELERKKKPKIKAGPGKPSTATARTPVIPRLSEAMAASASVAELSRIASAPAAAKADQERAEQETRRRKQAAIATVLMLSH